LITFSVVEISFAEAACVGQYEYNVFHVRPWVSPIFVFGLCINDFGALMFRVCLVVGWFDFDV